MSTNVVGKCQMVMVQKLTAIEGNNRNNNNVTYVSKLAVPAESRKDGANRLIVQLCISLK